MVENWKERKLTTFQYLMWINFAAGRSYNDLSQYPVFPWILDKSCLEYKPREYAEEKQVEEQPDPVFTNEFVEEVKRHNNVVDTDMQPIEEEKEL